jgi:preprotein translocase subunit SecY
MRSISLFKKKKLKSPAKKVLYTLLYIVLYRIGNISKIFNYYETASKNLSTDVQNWVMTFEDGVEYEKFKNQETIEVESTTEVAG